MSNQFNDHNLQIILEEAKTFTNERLRFYIQEIGRNDYPEGHKLYKPNHFRDELIKGYKKILAECFS